MNTVIISKNPLDRDDIEEWINVGDLCEFLATQFATFPETARIYHEVVAVDHDVTPHDEESIERLQKLEGTFHVIIMPEGVMLVLLIVSVAISAIQMVLSFVLRPSTNGNNQQSPNNELTNRNNKPRPNQRIPWICGTVRSIPDELGLTYKFFFQNQEFEDATLCIGVGSYTILDCLDSTTPIDNIDGEYVAIYGPNVSPSTGVPQVVFGSTSAPIPDVVAVTASNAVNGQILRAPNSGSFTTNNNVAFQQGGVVLTNDPSLDFTEYFAQSLPGNTQFMEIFTNDDGVNADDPNGIQPSVGLAGTYEILDVTPTTVTLSNVLSINPNWGALTSYAGGTSTFFHTFQINSVGNNQQGPFILTAPSMTEVWANFVAQNGLYYVDNQNRQGSLTVTIELLVQAVDENFNPVGDIISATGNIQGSALTRQLCGVTVKMVMPSSGAVQVWAKNLTPMPTDTRNNYSQEIQWRDLFAIEPFTSDFGNVTTVRAITAQTPDALGVKNRQLNIAVTRNLPTWINRSATGLPQMSTELFPTNNAADIFIAMALDETIGRRTISELDIAGIYAIADSSHLGGEHTDGSIVNYFGNYLMTEFNYTFADSKISFEESASYIAQAINCIAYRQGSTISLSFEQKTDASKLLFNHRNKIPKSDSRDVTFGPLNDNDGITYTYVDPNAPNYPNVDTVTTLYFPVDQSAINPKQVDSIGVRNVTQATINAWRMYQKLINANTQVGFTGTAEATELVINDRILVADNTRPDTQDGEITAQNGLVVSTSQPVNLLAGHSYTIFLQLYDGSIQSMPVTYGPAPKTLTLSTAPNLALVTDPKNWAKTGYIMVDNAATSTTKRPQAFLLTAKDPTDVGNFKISAINYSDLYYIHDTDIANGLVTVPQAGYGIQGYIGVGLVTQNGGAYVPSARASFNATAYNASTLAAQNNVAVGDQALTQPNTGLPSSNAITVDDATSTALSTNLNSGNPIAPAGSLNIRWQTDGNTPTQGITANVPLSTAASMGLLTQLPGTGVGYLRADNTWQPLPVYSTVATTGAYADLTGKPTLSTVATTGAYSDLTGKPTIPAAQVQTDWNATSGLGVLLNKPAIPAAQVNSDWNATAGLAQILNKPSFTRFAPALRTITTNDNSANTDYAINADATAGNITITLHIPTDNQVLTFKKMDLSINTVTLIGTIDGASSFVLTAQYASCILQYDAASSTWGIY